MRAPRANASPRPARHTRSRAAELRGERGGVGDEVCAAPIAAQVDVRQSQPIGQRVVVGVTRVVAAQLGVVRQRRGRQSGGGEMDEIDEVATHDRVGVHQAEGARRAFDGGVVRRIGGETEEASERDEAIPHRAVAAIEPGVQRDVE